MKTQVQRQTTVVGQFQGFILVQDRAGREQTVKSPTGGIVGGSAGEESAAGGQTDRQGLDGRQRVVQARVRYQVEWSR